MFSQCQWTSLLYSISPLQCVNLIKILSKVHMKSIMDTIIRVEMFHF